MQRNKLQAIDPQPQNNKMRPGVNIESILRLHAILSHSSASATQASSTSNYTDSDLQAITPSSCCILYNLQ